MDSKRIDKARLDISKASLIDDLNLNEIVEVTIRGRVTEIRGPSQELITSYSPSIKAGKGKDKEDVYCSPGTLTVEIQGFKVKGKSEFDEEDDD